LSPISKHSRLALALVALGFLALAALYSITTPAYEAPDEPGHVAYVLHLLTTRSLPASAQGELGEAHQPPLYYLLAALSARPANLDDTAGAFALNEHFVWAGLGGKDVNAAVHHTAETFPFQGHALALHLMRAVSVLLGLGTVLLTAAIGLAVFPQRPLIGLLAAALVGFNPQFLFISGAVNNDNLLITLASAAWLQLIRILDQPDRMRRWLVLGVLIALALLTKLSALVILGVAVVVLVAAAMTGRSLRLLALGAASLTAPIVIIAGWWFLRNQMLSGDPFGWTAFSQSYGAVLRQTPLSWADVQAFFSTQFSSFWGVFGWMNVRLPGLAMSAIAALCLLGLFGLIAFLVSGSWRRLAATQKASLLVLCLAILAWESYMLLAITKTDASWYQGRYIFPVIAPLMLMLSLGLVSLVPQRWAAQAGAVLAICLAGVALVVPFRVIGPAYVTVPLAKWQLWLAPHQTDIAFDDMLRLRAYSIDTPKDTPKDTAKNTAKDLTAVSVTLYWQALRTPDFDYSCFVHLVDQTGQVVAQQDQAPGGDAGFPPSVWWNGDLVADTHRISLPAGLSPGDYRLRVGLYNWQTGQQLPIVAPETPGSTSTILDQVVTMP
jgi:4-amino-4-deoxy-L-arabinose transferase-like glycosyltransferase